MKAIDFLEDGLWLTVAPTAGRLKRAGIKTLRVVVLALYGFRYHECASRAAALTFYTLFAVVPLVALALGIAKGFHWDVFLRQQIGEVLVVNRAIVPFLISFAERVLSVSGGLMGLIGFIILVWTAISVMNSIEAALNVINAVTRGRGVTRMFADYLAFILFGAVMIAISGGLTVMAQRVFSTGAVPAVILLSIGNLVVLSGLFSAVYYYIPNEPVDARAAAVGGITVALLYQTVQWVFIRFQIGVTQYNVIYGGLAALPLFLVWLRLSWMLLLFGAELAAAVMNRETHGYLPEGILSSCGRRADALGMMHRLAEAEGSENSLCSVRSAGDLMRMPFRTARNTLRTLERAGLIVETVPAETPAVKCFRLRGLCGEVTVAGIVDAIEQEEARRTLCRTRAAAAARREDEDSLVRLVRTALPDLAINGSGSQKERTHERLSTVEAGS